MLSITPVNVYPESLQEEGIAVELETFRNAHRQAALNI